MDMPLLSNLQQRRPNLYYLGPAILWAAAIFFISHQQGDDLPEINFPFFDKFAHGVIYAVLGFLTGRAWGRGRPISWRETALACLGIALYGISDEFHQQFVEGRSVDVMDWVLDVIGGGAGLVAWKQFAYDLLKRHSAFD